MENKISVIIVSYNTKKLTRNAIESFYDYVKTPFEMIVVDNASSDGSLEMLTKLQKKYRNLNIIKSDNNLGFGKANNLGAETAKGRYLLFVNSDTVTNTDYPKKMMEYFKKNKGIGILGGRLLNTDKSIQSNGGDLPNLIRIIGWQFNFDSFSWWRSLFGSLHASLQEMSKTKNVGWVTGAMFMISRKNYSSISGFDENIFMYAEDLDLCWRVKTKLNKKVIYYPYAYITHLGGGSSSSANSLIKEAEMLPYVIEKHQGVLNAALTKFIIKIGAIIRLVIFGFIFYDEAKTKAYRQILLG